MELFTDNKAINQLIINHKNDFQSIIEKLEKSEKQHFELAGIDFKPYTEHYKSYLLLSFYYDIIKSASKFVLSEDQYLASTISFDIKQIVFTAKFSRNNVEYTINTRAIYAGGYNIQRLHFRFITSGTIKSISATKSDVKIIKEKIKKLSKTETLQKEISMFEKAISNYETDLERLNNQTDEDYANEYDKNFQDYRDNLTWDVIVSREADKNYDGQEDFETKKAEHIQYILSKRNEAIRRATTNLKHYQKLIIKNQKKIDAL